MDTIKTNCDISIIDTNYINTDTTTNIDTTTNTDTSINSTSTEPKDETGNGYTCNCGKTYRMFKNYKSHFVKYKCPVQLVVINTNTANPTNTTTNTELDNVDVELEVGYNPILKSRRQLITKVNSGHASSEVRGVSQDNSTARIVTATTNNQQLSQQLNPEQVVEVLNDNKYSECTNCGLRLLKKNMRRHQSNNCKTSREIQLKQQIDAARNILSEYNNILVNNGIIGSNNVINDNRQIINVAINCITQEAKDHLTEEAKIEIVGRIFTAFDCLLDHIYKDDRNKNIYYLGNGKKEVKYISENGEVNVGDADNIIGNIAMSHLNYLDELIDTHRDAVPKPYQKTIDQLINFHSTEDCNPGYIKKTGQKIMSFREYAKAQVKKYEQEYISKHSGGQMVSN